MEPRLTPTDPPPPADGRDARLSALCILAGALMLFAAILAIGRPTVMTDTQDYYSEGHKLLKIAVVWVRDGEPPFTLEALREYRAHPRVANLDGYNDQNGGRSLFYGLFNYVVLKLGGLWLLAFAQALAAAATLFMLWTAALGRVRPTAWLATMAGLSLGSSLPVFCGFASPDVFSGLAAIAAILLLAYPDRMSRRGRVVAWLALVLFLAFHNANVLVVALLLAPALALLAWGRVPWPVIVRRTALVAVALGVALLAGKVHALMVWAQTGDHLRSPPFLAVRVLADGPGRKYLADTCGRDPRFALCAYRHLPLDDTEDILWSEDPARGVWDKVDEATRARIVREQIPFVLASIAHDPGGQLAASLRNWRNQLAAIGYQDALLNQSWFLDDAFWSQTRIAEMIQAAAPCDAALESCAFRLPPDALARWHAVLMLASLAMIALQLPGLLSALRRPADGAADGAAPDLGRAATAALLMLAAVLINAAVCGILSGPFPRYQARIVWLAPAAAMLLLSVRLAAATHRRRPRRRL